MVARKLFEENLQELHESLLRMGLLVEEAIYKSVKSFTENDTVLAQSVIENDKAINQYEVDIEKKCFELIATQQPVGTDLRRIGTMLKVVTDLERMGDHAVNIAKIAIELKNDLYLKPFARIPEMAETVKEMVHEGLSAYITLNEEKAVEVSKQDDQIDRDFRIIFNELMEDMKQNKANIHHASFMILVLQHLERIGDYVTNVCEWIVYLKTGTIVDLNR
ncbi:phosphate transport system regulatory protein PhoU [Weizmannia acidilactici]|uniref:Phosphate-specific transport system accessory protein PhoU n=1 Tax=Weizmannia acidilactici TaxID=2607726 RepID=A0A5J4J197_9BACI|nr:phosphate signaling complex protein PhoU [Weizmannia acidilactici]GER65964.1 phosphate transport system regulatory protein PhoU [Weizmannia acidilactici]GER68822.1 phosphate transport system regulatory protein PhoU [Weizmannia acidilactici]GER72893.1 phosphate transport system regulatory protein PhoU [Weizmannia acidilactici]